MGNVIDHPGRPSVRIGEYRAELLAEARYAEAAGNSHTAALLRSFALHRLLRIQVDCEEHYETRVSALLGAALDVLDGGGFSGDPEHALVELRRAANQLRYAGAALIQANQQHATGARS